MTVENNILKIKMEKKIENLFVRCLYHNNNDPKLEPKLEDIILFEPEPNELNKDNVIGLLNNVKICSVVWELSSIMRQLILMSINPIGKVINILNDIIDVNITWDPLKKYDDRKNRIFNMMTHLYRINYSISRDINDLNIIVPGSECILLSELTMLDINKVYISYNMLESLSRINTSRLEILKCKKDLENLENKVISILNFDEIKDFKDQDQDQVLYYKPPEEYIINLLNSGNWNREVFSETYYDFLRDDLSFSKNNIQIIKKQYQDYLFDKQNDKPSEWIIVYKQKEYIYNICNEQHLACTLLKNLLKNKKNNPTDNVYDYVHEQLININVIRYTNSDPGSVSKIKIDFFGFTDHDDPSPYGAINYTLSTSSMKLDPSWSIPSTEKFYSSIKQFRSRKKIEDVPKLADKLCIQNCSKFIGTTNPYYKKLRELFPIHKYAVEHSRRWGEAIIAAADEDYELGSKDSEDSDDSGYEDNDTIHYKSLENYPMFKIVNLTFNYKDQGQDGEVGNKEPGYKFDIINVLSNSVVKKDIEIKVNEIKNIELQEIDCVLHSIWSTHNLRQVWITFKYVKYPCCDNRSENELFYWNHVQKWIKRNVCDVYNKSVVVCGDRIELFDKYDLQFASLYKENFHTNNINCIKTENMHAYDGFIDL